MNVNVFSILQKVYGARGIPFPKPPKDNSPSKIAPSGDVVVSSLPVVGRPGEYESPAINERATGGSLIRKFEDELLGTYHFLPATINDVELPNAVVIISGEKEIVQTDIVDVGTVFEKVFTRPYDVSIIVTLIGENGNWVEDKLKTIRDLYLIDEVVTLKCALTDIFLQKQNNFIISKINVLDNQGSENVEVIQIDGMSNIDFELEIL